MLDRNETHYADTEITSFNPDGTISGTSVVNSVSGSDLVVSHSVNGDFHSPNDYDYTVRSVRLARGTIRTWREASLLYESVGNQGEMVDLRALEPVYREDVLYAKALDRLNEKARGSLDLSTSALEYRETLRMLRGAGSIRSYLGNTINAAAKKGPVRASTALKKLVKDAGGNWLQFKLGLQPLLSDFHDSVKELCTGVVLQNARIKGKAVNRIAIKTVPSYTPHPKNTEVNIEGIEGVEFHVQFRPVDQFNVSRWASLNPIGWAWELIPLSFVIDYFVDVGSTIKNVETALLYNTTFDSGYVTYLQAHVGTGRVRGTRLYPLLREEFSPMTVSVEFKKFRRERLSGWPLPRVPSFQANLGSSQLVTIAALLSQRLR